LNGRGQPDVVRPPQSSLFRHHFCKIVRARISPNSASVTTPFAADTARTEPPEPREGGDWHRSETTHIGGRTRERTTEHRAYIFIVMPVILATLVAEPAGWREAIMVSIAVAACLISPPQIHRANEFTLAPIKEAAWISLGIFGNDNSRSRLHGNARRPARIAFGSTILLRNGRARRCSTILRPISLSSRGRWDCRV
jgi:hypothetical protein